jgi:hypothetical protein
MKCSHEKCQIRYRKLNKYKYVTNRSYSVQTGISGHDVNIGSFVKLAPNGVMTIGKGYAWDGPSSPAIDTKNFMRGSLIHDAFYQLIRERYVPKSVRKPSDKLLVEMTKEDGMGKFRCWYVYWGVRIGGGFAVLFRRVDQKERCAP